MTLGVGFNITIHSFRHFIIFLPVFPLSNSVTSLNNNNNNNNTINLDLCYWSTLRKKTTLNNLLLNGMLKLTMFLFNIFFQKERNRVERRSRLRTLGGSRVHLALTTESSGDIDETTAIIIIKRKRTHNEYTYIHTHTRNTQTYIYKYIYCHAPFSSTLLLKINKYLLVNLSLLSTTSQGLLLFLLGNLRSLRLDLTGTGQRTVNFTLFNIFFKNHAKKK